MTIKIGINGFGRIGRNVLRSALQNFSDIEVVGINDLLEPHYLAYMLQYDSVHGRFKGEVSVEGNTLVVNGKKIRLTQERDPANLKWNEVGATVVIESTGLFLDKVTAQKHIDAGATKVILSAPSKDDTPMFVFGVNEKTYKGEAIVSNASCTTNCLAPLAKVINDKFGIKRGLGEEAGWRRVVAALDEALDPHRDASVTLLVENTAGQGTAVGWRLEQLALILDHVAHRARVGLCLDTCHLFAAGYDLRTPEAYQSTIAEIDRRIGLDRLHVWHLNDSLRELAGRIDRHTHIGCGAIGIEGFRLLVNDPRFAAHPMILETPKENDAGRPMDPVNLRLLRRLAGKK